MFVAFDLLWLNGRYFRDQPLVDRKAATPEGPMRKGTERS